MKSATVRRYIEHVKRPIHETRDSVEKRRLLGIIVGLVKEFKRT